MVGVENERQGRSDQDTRALDDLWSNQSFPLTRWPYLGICWDTAGALLALGVADFN